jgi:DHA1 family multidrug resistance protein-like MFS transporter
MSELFRDTVAGFFIRAITAKRFLRYPEEIPGFEIPTPFVEDANDDSALEKADEKDVGQEPSRLSTSDEDVERGNTLQSIASHVIHPVVTKDGVILVDWYSDGRSLNIQHLNLCR